MGSTYFWGEGATNPTEVTPTEICGARSSDRRNLIFSEQSAVNKIQKYLTHSNGKLFFLFFNLLISLLIP